MAISMVRCWRLSGPLTAVRLSKCTTNAFIAHSLGPSHNSSVLEENSFSRSRRRNLHLTTINISSSDSRSLQCFYPLGLPSSCLSIIWSNHGQLVSHFPSHSVSRHLLRISHTTEYASFWIDKSRVGPSSTYGPYSVEL